MKLTVCIVLFFGILASAQDDKQLSAELKKADSLLFEACFNRCDFKTLDEITHKDLRFLHDVAGMQNKAEFTEAVRKNICGNGSGILTRKPVEGSFKVYPLKKDGKLYGAVQHGDHEFFQSGKKTGIAKFTHTWLLENGRWILYNVISYDHKSAGDGK